MGDFTTDLAAARAARKPVMALRYDSQGLDDVVVENVTMFRAEMMDYDDLWLCCYFANGQRVTFSAFARKRGCLEFRVGEMPSEWDDFDARPPVSPPTRKELFTDG